MINTYERICADDLRGMIRKENHFLVLISDHEFAEVLARIVTVLFANCQEALVHIVWVRDADIFYVLDPDEVLRYNAYMQMNYKSSLVMWNMS